MKNLTYLTLLILALSSFLMGCDSNKKATKTPLPRQGSLLYSPKRDTLSEKKATKEQPKTQQQTENTPQKETESKTESKTELANTVSKTKKSKPEYKIPTFKRNKSGYTKLTFQILAGFDLAKSSFLDPKTSTRTYHIPKELKALQGQRVIVEGYMMPIHFEKGQTNKFMLLSCQADCCYGKMPRLNEWVTITMKDKKRVKALKPAQRCKVYGVLDIGKKRLNGDSFESFYRMEANKIRIIDPKVPPVLAPK